ncbi:uroporphyrinogen-III C-methyltransferase [Carboxylicivirga marina]|uniref:uroporphyrinogen-III C-methyltransferase n=1 Tax=Carboxylicivirga marina TaxID=2800988 RepID=A0ABS1HIS1_9BACT|nr:uroporphyrinogen-III C-methyltransferase [Carboxylicivirga marina]MBK3517198.1 uroporphyrinogen-III C-methyltransferase [Carboxylicivirga marina]
MMKIHIRTFVNDFNGLYQTIEKALPVHTDFTWSYQKNATKLTTGQLIELLMQAVDLVLIPVSEVQYINANELNVVALLDNQNDTSNPLALIAVNNQVIQKIDDLQFDIRKQYGRVYIVGFGPGSPDLLTIRAQRLIEEADVVYYDDLLDDTYLKSYNAELVYVGKRKGKHSAKQQEINERLYKSALNGKKVLRLKGGDPLVFGRGAEEYHYLSQRFVDVCIVPGVTSALAAAAEAVIPLTSRGVSASVAFTLGHDAVYNKLPKADTLVFYMGASQQRNWANRLMQEGWAPQTPVACVQNASLKNQKCLRYTLAELVNSHEVLPAPALIIVGQTVKQYVAGRPQRWLYTGSDLSYFKEEGEVVHNPMVKIQKIPLERSQVELVKNIRAFNRIVFVTPHAVHEFFNALFECELDARILSDVEIDSIGESTSKALKQYGLLIPASSATNSINGLVDCLKNEQIVDEDILLPCSSDGLSILPDALRQMGNRPYEFKLYDSVLPDNAVRHNLDDFTGIVFSSPKAVRHFFQLHNCLPKGIQVKVRGVYTKMVLEKYISKSEMPVVVLSTENLSEFDT